jgi:hypothetical protein
MTSKIWCILPSTILTPCNNILILISINGMYHFKPLAGWHTLTDPRRALELLLLLPILSGLSNNTTGSPEHNRTYVVPVLGHLLGIAMQHVARILADHIRHLHDAHQSREGTFLVDVCALPDAHDVLELAVLQGCRVDVQKAVFVTESTLLDE